MQHLSIKMKLTASRWKHIEHEMPAYKYINIWMWEMQSQDSTWLIRLNSALSDFAQLYVELSWVSKLKRSLFNFVLKCHFILEASWITSASKTSRDSQYGLFSVDTCSNNNKNKFITCSLCSTEGKKRLRYNWMVYFSCSNKIYRVKSDFLPPLWKPEEHILQVSLNSLGQLVC